MRSKSRARKSQREARGVGRGARWVGLLLVVAAGVWARVGTAQSSVPYVEKLVAEPELAASLLQGELAASDRKRDVEHLPWILGRQFAPHVTAPGRGPLRFLTPEGIPIPPGAPIPTTGVRLLPVAAGETGLRLASGLVDVNVVSMRLLRAVRPQDGPLRGWALSRVLPSELALADSFADEDTESVVLRVEGPLDVMPNVVQVNSFGQDGRYLDGLRNVPLMSAPCPSEDLACASTAALRLVPDWIDRHHPKIAARSLVAEVGGRVELRLSEALARGYVVRAPAGIEPPGQPAFGRYRLELRTRLVNMQAGGPPPIGSDPADALAIARDQIAAAGRLWGQCGIALGPAESWDIEVVDPPEVALLEVGCEGSVRASGGQISFQLDGRAFDVGTAAGQTPLEVARGLAQVLRKRGYRVRVLRNAPATYSALSSYDLVVHHASGAVPQLEPRAGVPVSNDPTLGVCQGRLDLGDGLDHFSDLDAARGTREERILLRALADSDPSTIELIIVPLFSGTGRIGESFIQSPSGSLNSALILDRGGVRAGAKSLTLAHELGHILLDLPGHPDEFGVDTPSSLMDADASDATIFGPRRLSLEDCQRVLLQSGPTAPTPLLQPWPL